MEKDSNNTYVIFLAEPHMFVVRNVNNLQAAVTKARDYFYENKVGGYRHPNDVVEDLDFSDSPEILSGSCTMDKYAGEDAAKEIEKYFKGK